MHRPGRSKRIERGVVADLLGLGTGPLVVGNRMYVLTRKGKLVAFTVGGEL